MKKINKTAYNKLCIQAEEAKNLNMIKLANNIYSAIGALPDEEKLTYSSEELQNDIHKEMWKLATNILHYYDLKSVDAQKLDSTLNVIATYFIEEIKNSLNVDNDIGIREPELPGEHIKK